jgi:hypothetical protein
MGMRSDIVIRSPGKGGDKACTSDCPDPTTTVIEFQLGNSVFLTRLCDRHALELGQELIAFVNNKPVRPAHP